MNLQALLDKFRRVPQVGSFHALQTIIDKSGGIPRMKQETLKRHENFYRPQKPAVPSKR